MESVNSLKAFFKATQIRYVRWNKRRLWQSRWSSPDFQPSWLSDKPRPFVISGFERGWLVPPMKVLEIGCGLGTAAAWLAERGLEVVGIDVSEQAIEQARKIYLDRSGLEFMCSDVCASPNIVKQFDVILDTGCLQHIPKCLRDGYCRNLLRWSRTGSRFVVTMHKRGYSAQDRLEEVQALFSANFDLICIEEVQPNDATLKHLNSVFHFVRR